MLTFQAPAQILDTNAKKHYLAWQHSICFATLHCWKKWVLVEFLFWERTNRGFVCVSFLGLKISILSVYSELFELLIRREVFRAPQLALPIIVIVI